MTVYELNRNQLDELKSHYFWSEETANIPKLDHLGRPALFPGDIPDAVIYKYYIGIDFVNDDFFCTANTPAAPQPLRVCPRCLMAIESREGSQITRKIYLDDDDETPCDWCEEADSDILYEIL